MSEPKKCPKCDSNNFGIGSGEPVTVSGWYGQKQFQWGRYAGVHMVKITGLRCGDCGHEVSVDPNWDQPLTPAQKAGIRRRRARTA